MWHDLQCRITACRRGKTDGIYQLPARLLLRKGGLVFVVPRYSFSLPIQVLSTGNTTRGGVVVPDPTNHR